MAHLFGKVLGEYAVDCALGRTVYAAGGATACVAAKWYDEHVEPIGECIGEIWDFVSEGLTYDAKREKRSTWEKWKLVFKRPKELGVLQAVGNTLCNLAGSLVMDAILDGVTAGGSAAVTGAKWSQRLLGLPKKAMKALETAKGFGSVAGVLPGRTRAKTLLSGLSGETAKIVKGALAG